MKLSKSRLRALRTAYRHRQAEARIRFDEARASLGELESDLREARLRIDSAQKAQENIPLGRPISAARLDSVSREQVRRGRELADLRRLEKGLAARAEKAKDAVQRAREELISAKRSFDALEEAAVFETD